MLQILSKTPRWPEKRPAGTTTTEAEFTLETRYIKQKVKPPSSKKQFLSFWSNRPQLVIARFSQILLPGFPKINYSNKFQNNLKNRTHGRWTKVVHLPCVQIRDINSPVSNYAIGCFWCRLAVFDRLAHNLCLDIEFGVGFDKFQGTNRRLYRPLSGGICLFPAFWLPFPESVKGSIFSTILILVSISLGITG